jgi:hypothetical protein
MACAAANAELDVGFARQFVKPALIIVDVCDSALAINKLSPKQTIPIDLNSDTDGQGIDEEDAALREQATYRDADLVAALGILERFPEPAAALLRLCRFGRPVLCSIGALDHTSRSTKLSSFESLCTEAGLSIVWRYLNEGRAIYLLTPAGKDASDVTTAGYRSRSDMVTALRNKRPALLVAGFFGRGNCGDEALFQVIYEQFSPRYDVIVSLDEHGATEGYWNLYPYDRCLRIHQGNLADPARSCTGMIVGGGGLPLGFVADQVLAARSAGIPVALAGTDFPESNIHSGEAAQAACRDYLDLFDVIAPRSSTAVEQARRTGKSAIHGADWALGLLSDRNEDIRHVANRALVVLREFPMRAVSFRYTQRILGLIDDLRRSGFEPTLLPFCFEDDLFARTLGLDLAAPSERHWWNARRVKQLIASSGLVVSVGRLHPMIFAADARTPVVQVCPPLAEDIDQRSFPKISVMSGELDVDFLPAMESVADYLKNGLSRASGRHQLDAARDRLSDMVARLHGLFGP